MNDFSSTQASDVPSMFSLHMNGAAPPTPKFDLQPFGIDMGPFEKQSEYYKFSSPHLVAARTKILDYFASQHDTVREDHIIFRFEHSMEMGFESQLLKQASRI
jgi:hypothetical protein